MTLTDYLKRTGTSQSAFARQLGVTPAYVNHLVHGRKSPGLQSALAIAQATKGKVRPTDWLKHTKQA